MQKTGDGQRECSQPTEEKSIISNSKSELNSRYTENKYNTHFKKILIFVHSPIIRSFFQKCLLNDDDCASNALRKENVLFWKLRNDSYELRVNRARDVKNTIKSNEIKNGEKNQGQKGTLKNAWSWFGATKDEIDERRKKKREDERRKKAGNRWPETGRRKNKHGKW